MAKRLLMLVGDFAEDYETMVPFQALQMVGHEVHAVRPGKKAGEKMPDRRARLRGRPDLQREAGAQLHQLNANFDEVDLSNYDALVIPGGRAPEYLRLHERVLTVVRHFAEDGKPIAAVCHGAQLLAAADVIKGRRVSAYPACAPEVELAGGQFLRNPDRRCGDRR